MTHIIKMNVNKYYEKLYPKKLERIEKIKEDYYKMIYE